MCHHGCLLWATAATRAGFISGFDGDTTLFIFKKPNRKQAWAQWRESSDGSVQAKASANWGWQGALIILKKNIKGLRLGVLLNIQRYQELENEPFIFEMQKKWDKKNTKIMREKIT
jgi:hypothetical protein